MISVCIATYNASKYIHEQLVSILDQLSYDDELVISDDLSSDNTIDLIFNLNDSRIRVIQGPHRLGVVKNFERALTYANGELIFLADQDDVWLPNKVSISVKLLQSNLLVVSDCIVVDEKLNLINKSFFSLRRSKKGIIHNIYKNSYIGCCMAFRSELLDYALPIPSNISMHDVWLGIIAEVVGEVMFTQERLLLYRRHQGNFSALNSKNTLFTKINMRLNLVCNLLNRLSFILIKKIR